MAGLEKFRIEVKYVRRARRATLRVKPGYLLKLSLPYGVKKSQIEEWVLSKAAWILEKHEMLEARSETPELQFSEGSEVPFAGGTVRLRSSSSEKGTVLSGSELIVPQKHFKSEATLRKAVIKWYQEQALAAAIPAVESYAQRLGAKASTVRIKNYRSRWGACSSKGEIIFNWQIILLKKEMFDYVVAHEVCHLLEMNHSERFYRLLSGLGFNKSEMHRQFKHLRNLI